MLPFLIVVPYKIQGHYSLDMVVSVDNFTDFVARMNKIPWM